jgi:hypothetical protein
VHISFGYHGGAPAAIKRAGFPVVRESVTADGEGPMSGFDDREKGFEAKFRLDEETKFRARARRNRLLGIWVAEKLGLKGDDAEAYAREVVAADLEKPGDDDVIEKVMTDIRTHGLAIDAKEIARQLAAFEQTARAQVLAEKK